MAASKNNIARLERDFNKLCELIEAETCMMPQTRSVVPSELIENFEQFAYYYFPHYTAAPFGWFHKQAAAEIIQNKDGFFVLEWAREHAKSVLADVLLPMFLYLRGEVTGVIIASANGEKAAGLLSDLQAEFVSNARLKADWGEKMNTSGKWSDGYFTVGSVGFWAFGRGQSPRGVRVAGNRPNYAVCDDIDDKTIVKNALRVTEATNWVLEDLYGALAIQGSRLVIAGNRIHKKSILAHIVGDIDDYTPKRKEIKHIKVCAFENPKTHEKLMPELGGVPAWKERYTEAELLRKMNKMGFASARREFFHETVEDGLIFKPNWITYKQPQKRKEYNEIVVYCDPSFSSAKTADYKAIVAVGRIGNEYTILKVWARQTSIAKMVEAMYDFYSQFNIEAKYYIEANFVQKILLQDFDREAKARGYNIPLRTDTQKKADKNSRIEAMSVLFERGLVSISEDEARRADCQLLIEQLLAFPNGAHDDAPDALEGAISRMRGGKGQQKIMITGKYKKQ